MELESHESAGSTLTMKWKGELMAPEAARMCLMLAFCKCDRVPALLFLRPFVAQTRWSVNGEIEFTIPCNDAIPQWPNKIFMENAKLDGVPTERDFIFSATALGILDKVSNGIESIHLAPVFQGLHRQAILRTVIEDDFLFFQMDETSREEIWKQTTGDDRLIAWFDLLKLVIYSYPDVYSEFLWRKVVACCKTVIKSTIMPFISIMDWHQLQPHRSIVKFLISFLIHHSSSDGFNSGNCLNISRALWEHFRDTCTREVNSMITILDFRDALAHLLLQAHPEEQQNFGLIFKVTQSCLDTPRLRGLFGFLISSFLTSTQKFAVQFDFHGAVQLWQNALDKPLSIMEKLTNVPFAIRSSIADRDELLLSRMNSHTLCAISSAIVESSDYFGAYQYLTACLEDFGKELRGESVERFAMMIELVKCCNSLGKNTEAEALARRVLKELPPKSILPSQLWCMQIALADSYIGQSKYRKAQKILKKMLLESLHAYLRQAVMLRFIKVERRLGTLGKSLLTEKWGFMATLIPNRDVGDDVRCECFDELSSALQYIRQGIPDDTTTSRSTATSERSATRSKAMDEKGWRALFLDDQIQRLKKATLDHEGWRELIEHIQSALEDDQKGLHGSTTLPQTAGKILDATENSSEHGTWSGNQSESLGQKIGHQIPLSSRVQNEFNPPIPASPTRSTFEKPSTLYGMPSKRPSLMESENIVSPQLSIDKAVPHQFNDTGSWKRLREHSDWIIAITFSPDGERMASGSRDNTIKLWDVFAGALQMTLREHLDSVRAIAFSSDGTQIASGSNDRTIRLWDSTTGKLLQTFQGHSGFVNSVSFSPDQRQIVSGSDDGTVRLWDLLAGASCETLKWRSSCGSSWVIAVAFSPDGKQIVSGSVDGTVRFWDLVLGKEYYEIHIGQGGLINTIVFSPDGKQIASGSDDATVQLWDPVTGSLDKTLLGHSSSVDAIAFSPDGKQIASGSTDGLVRLWDLVRGAWFGAFLGHSRSVNSIVLSPDGRKIACGSADTTISLLDISSIPLYGILGGEKDSIRNLVWYQNKKKERELGISTSSGVESKRISEHDGSAVYAHLHGLTNSGRAHLA